VRPVLRGASPRASDYPAYRSARSTLVARIAAAHVGQAHLASYCSYCERPIVNLAVEHIEPKDGPYGQPSLIGRWTNFLLACTNCNSTKKDKQVITADLYFPDRDNTFAAFAYLPDGNVVPAPGLGTVEAARAEATLKLVGLDKEQRVTRDSKGRVIAEDRASQRMQAWGQAEEGLAALEARPGCHIVEELVLKNALLCGFFSVWMTVFSAHPAFKQRLLSATAGTSNSGCFDGHGNSISPSPNLDGLPDGGKI